ncbi:uncharacterized protein LOC113238138 [Hyposmocoma kahamanoa]|uniref:uncharacterized protein LOC113238138 n=1 Tax=Hyposmocoma kahamanoa TaxID=1477025 RepID=UPI000E6D7BDF|nr:uncharacterized protein LOC113238138 [Hyposmocoma kahamanoa]
MGEQEDQIDDMSNSEMMFDNLTILKEFSNIVDLVRNEDFLEMVPKAKLKRVKWMPMFNCLKRVILDEMIQEISDMWKYENMPQKLEMLEKQKEKFNDVNTENKLWRPQLDDVKAQLRAHNVADLQRQKILLESLAKEHEARLNRLKKTLTAKRGYLKALQMDVQKYQKKNEEFVLQIHAKIENHKNLTNAFIPTKLDIESVKWIDADLEIMNK